MPLDLGTCLIQAFEFLDERLKYMGRDGTDGAVGGWSIMYLGSGALSGASPIIPSVPGQQSTSTPLSDSMIQSAPDSRSHNAQRLPALFSIVSVNEL